MLGGMWLLGDTKGVTWERTQLRTTFVSSSVAARICQTRRWRCQLGLGHSCRDADGAKVAGTPSPLCSLSRRGHGRLYPGRAHLPPLVWPLPQAGSVFAGCLDQVT